MIGSRCIDFSTSCFCFLFSGMVIINHHLSTGCLEAEGNMVVFQDICGCPDELVTHIVAELSDVCLLISQAELICHPSVGFRFTQDSLFPDLIEDSVCLNPLQPKFPVGKSPFGSFGSRMHADIGIAGWIVGADINLSAMRMRSIYKGCIS